MTKEKKIFQPLTSNDVCVVYDLLYNEGLVSFPRKASAQSIIEAIVSNVNGTSFGESHYKTVEEKVVAYLYSLIKNHPFVDGNKRTALLVFLLA